MSCLKQKGIGPSEWKLNAFLLAKQNVKDAKNSMCMEGLGGGNLWMGSGSKKGAEAADEEREASRGLQCSANREVWTPVHLPSVRSD